MPDSVNMVTRQTSIEWATSDEDVKIECQALESAASLNPDEVKAQGIGPPSKEVGASWVSIMTYSWVTPIITLAKRLRYTEGRELEMRDLWQLPDADRAEPLSEKLDRFRAVWRKKHKPGNALCPSSPAETSKELTWSISQVVKRDMLIAGGFKLIETMAKISFPLLLSKILDVIESIADEEIETDLREGFLWVLALGMSLFVSILTENLHLSLIFRAGWQIRTMLTMLVYQKTLQISAASRQVMTTGEIVNLMQLDARSISTIVFAVHMPWSAMLQILGYLGVLYFYIEWAMLTSFGVFSLAMPIVYLIFKLIYKYEDKWVQFTDARVLKTNEVLQFMEGIKMSGLELNFASELEKIRKQELKQARSVAYLLALGDGTMLAIPTLAAVSALVAYASFDLGDINAATLFTVLVSFSLLKEPVTYLPNLLAMFSDFSVRRKRVAKYASLEEKIDGRNQSNAGKPVGSVTISEGEFFWANPSNGKKDVDASESHTKLASELSGPAPDQVEGESRGKASQIARGAVLRDINLSVVPGTLTGVCGPVASGKSSLCSAIVNEMFLSSGAVETVGSVAYCAQTPWIFHSTIRENILFGEPFIETRYQDVLQACQLARDLNMLEEGDQTVVGEQGINLSGGQKARISLARAAYSSRDILVLDDPLSALDPGVAVRVFDQCILKFLRGRTRVLVTNQLQLLPKCDCVVVLQDVVEGEPGGISEQGKYADLAQRGQGFSRKLRDFSGEEGGTTDTTRRDEKKEEDEEGEGSSGQEQQVMVASSGEGKDIMDEEERKKGAVSFKVYTFYARSGGGIFIAFLVLGLLLSSELASIASQTWVSVWVDDVLYETFSMSTYLSVYAASGALILLTICFGMFSIMVFCLVASKNLHVELVRSVFRAPMTFFNTTPTGRIVSRFSQDLQAVDEDVPGNVIDVLLVLFASFVGVITIGAVTPFFLLTLPILGPVYYAILQLYRPVMRDLKRMDSITKSPLYSHFTETLQGLSTIRAYDASSRFLSANISRVDQNMKPWYLLRFVTLWLFLRLAFMGAVINLLAGAFAILAAESGSLTPGFAGLSLTVAITLTDLLGGLVREGSELEAAFNAVERIKYYIEDIPQEKSFTSANPPKHSWPSRGNLEIVNLNMRYRPELPLVLKNVNLSIRGGERIGIVGRTGCGKSSLMLALMRLVEPELLEDGSGPVRIDGIDVSKIGLHELRNKISIVPQNPMLFSGTFRSNLDPFGMFQDENLWKVLDDCTLKEAVVEFGGLDSAVSEFGENLSQGQRQLLVLSRALLNDMRILLLDEATSSLDHASDAAIQRSLRKNFAQATCITIAHRLHTVVDSDRILVLDNGHVLEYEAPSKLLDNSSSAFFGMVAELGPDMAAKLKRKARSSPSRFSESSDSSFS